jgi:hypothetical protein
MKTLTLDPADLQVESFASAVDFHSIWAAADTDDADCDTESRPDCPTAEAECETLDCTHPEACGAPTEGC